MMLAFGGVEVYSNIEFSESERGDMYVESSYAGSAATVETITCMEGWDMAYDGVLKDIRKAIMLGRPERMPVMALTEEFDVGYSGLTYEEYAADAEKAAQVHIRAIQDFNYDWACIYIDDCIEFEPLGIKTVGSGNIPRSAREFVPATQERLKSLRIPDPHKECRMLVLLEAIRMVRRRFGDSVFISGRSPAPFSAATLLLGVEQVMLMMYDNPRLLSEFIDFLLNSAEAYAKAQLDAGAHALWVGDCSSSSRFLSTENYKRFAMEPAREHLIRLKTLGATTIYFAAEKDPVRVALTGELDADILAVSEDADLEACIEAAGDRVCIMGNLDPIHTMLNGDPVMIRAEVKRILDISRDGGHLFNTGEGVPASTPVENMRTLVDTLRGYW